MTPAGLFETILVRDGVPVRLEAHLARLARSAAALDLPPPPPGDALADRCREVARIARRGRMRVAVDASGVRVQSEAFPGYAAALYRDGAVAEIAAEAGHPLGAHAGHKVIPYDVLARIRAGARDRGAVDVVLRDGDGALLEGCASNLFVVTDGTVRTPPLSRPVLPGVTRAAAIRALADLGREVEEADVLPADLGAASEAFLTGSLMLAMPLRRIGDRALRPGPVAAAALEALGHVPRTR